MANQLMWYHTKLPGSIIDNIESDLSQFDCKFTESKVEGSGIDYSRRKNKTYFLEAHNWISGLCYHYISLANKNNFRYDIDGFANDLIQYSSYKEGEYYHWHVDSSIGVSIIPGENKEENFIKLGSEQIRKLSITLQLSNPEDYSGGEFQLLTDENESFFAPKEKGTIVIFDSRLRHRVRKVNWGERKSLVGWAVGPRWK